MAEVLFGYTHVGGVPRCPCGDPGNYMMAEQPGDDPLEVRLRCWCGSTNTGRFDDLAERSEFIARHGGSGTNNASCSDGSSPCP